MGTKKKTHEEVVVLEKQVDLYEIVLFNDDIHTFEFVINALLDVCDHTLEQAEQCTLLVHYKGKCAVKSGEYKELKPRCTRLLSLGLSAKII
jgi:ATP-dependent Clp protease adaptor protein ClpS